MGQIGQSESNSFLRDLLPVRVRKHRPSLACTNGDAPNYLKQMFVPLSEVHMHSTHNNSTGLFPFHTNTSSGQKSFAFAGCQVCNSLLEDVWTSQTIGDFKLKLRKHLKMNNQGKSYYDV